MKPTATTLRLASLLAATALGIPLLAAQTPATDQPPAPAAPSACDAIEAKVLNEELAKTATEILAIDKELIFNDPPNDPAKDAELIRRLNNLKDWKADLARKIAALAPAAAATPAAVPAQGKARYPTATRAPGQPGFVVSPRTGKAIDVRGIRKGAVVKDPTAPKGERMYFIVPPTAVPLPEGNDHIKLNERAWSLLTAPKPSAEDISTAEKLTTAALGHCSKLDNIVRLEILDTRARALFMRGKRDEAVKLQREIVETAANEMAPDDLISMLRATLESYEKGQLPDAKPTPAAGSGLAEAGGAALPPPSPKTTIDELRRAFKEPQLGFHQRLEAYLQAHGHDANSVLVALHCLVGDNFVEYHNKLRQDAVRRFPDNPLLRWEQVKCDLANANDPGKIEDSIAQLRKLHPESATLEYVAAAIAVKNGRLDQLSAMVKQAVERREAINYDQLIGEQVVDSLIEMGYPPMTSYRALENKTRATDTVLETVGAALEKNPTPENVELRIRMLKQLEKSPNSYPALMLANERKNFFRTLPADRPMADGRTAGQHLQDATTEFKLCITIQGKFRDHVAAQLSPKQAQTFISEALNRGEIYAMQGAVYGMDLLESYMPHYMVARPVPGKPGFVVSPNTGETVDVRGIRNGALVKDSTAPKGERGYFVMPSAANQTQDGNAPRPLNDPAILNEYAWSRLNTPEPSGEDVTAAAALSEAALEHCGNDPDLRAKILDTRARALFQQDNHDKAVELQEEAVKTCKDATLRASLVKTLESYKQGKLPDLTD